MTVEDMHSQLARYFTDYNLRRILWRHTQLG